VITHSRRSRVGASSVLTVSGRSPRAASSARTSSGIRGEGGGFEGFLLLAVEEKTAGAVAALIRRRRRMRFNIADPSRVEIRSTHRPLVVSLTNVSSIPWAHLHLLARVHRHPLTRTIEPLSGEPCGTLIRRSGSPSCDTRRAFNYGMMDIVACQFVNYSRRCYRRCSTLLPTDRAIFGERISSV